MATHGRLPNWPRSTAEFDAAGCRSAAISAALAPELIHPGERLWVLALECIPAFQIGHRPSAREFSSVVLQRACMHFESEEFESLAVEKFLDPRNGEPMLLHVKQQIAASADAEEIRKPRQRRQWLEYLLTAATDVGRRRVEATLGDEPAAGDDIGARELTVQTEPHQSTGPQQLEQLAPAGGRIGQMMQHAARFDQIERTADRSERQNICLCIFDVRQTELACLALRVRKARQAEIDRQHLGAVEAACRSDGMLAAAAAGDQNIDAAAMAEWPKR